MLVAQKERHRPALDVYFFIAGRSEKHFADSVEKERGDSRVEGKKGERGGRFVKTRTWERLVHNGERKA